MSKEQQRNLQNRRIIDNSSRLRRQRKALEVLEQDNFQDDPHANIALHKKAPKFEDVLETRGKRRKGRSNDYYKQRFRKTFLMLLEEEHMIHPDPPNYQSAQALPSRFPRRRFCSVCGFPSNYSCICCGIYYCGLRCLRIHEDTRCQKWIA